MNSFAASLKKLAVITALVTAVIVLQSFVQQRQEHEEPLPKNLKILPKNTSGEDVKKIMRTYSKSLGVKCNHCHVSRPQEGNPFPNMDFASDDKTEKVVARKMMVMVDSINSAFLNKIGGEASFEKITCVTCHMGRVTPIVSVDSLVKK